MEKLFDIKIIILEQFVEQRYYSRKALEGITLDNFVTGIVGARGIGKTTFLLHSVIKNGAKQRRALYLSADNIYLLEHRLLELVDRLYKETNVRSTPTTCHFTMKMA
jgi:predicted AAA+ superfamily ATPase